MKSIIKFAIAVMFTAGFHQASADVCKLKVNDDVKKALHNYHEVWVDKNSGEVWYKSGSIYRRYGAGAVRRENVDTLVHIVQNSIKAFDGDGIKGRYKDAIFCSTKPGKEKEVIIYVGNIKNEQAKVMEAKRQFENIIKCGLLKEVPQSSGNKIVVNVQKKEMTNQSTFNPLIFDTPFVGIKQLDVTTNNCDKFASLKIKNNSYYACDQKWQMPGISAFVKDVENAANVYCAMKTRREGKSNFWTVDNYLLEGIPEKDGERYFYSYEHTERQLVVNHMFNEKLAKGTAEYKHDRNLLQGVEYNDKHNLYDGNLFVWTKGNPCTSACNDNGSICCVQWYNKINEVLSKNNYVYFSELKANRLENENEYDADTSSIKNILKNSKIFDRLQNCSYSDNCVNKIMPFFEDELYCHHITVEDAFNCAIIHMNTKLKLIKS